MWRANRLADFLAKMAASATRLPARLISQLGVAGDLARHNLALLGVVTKAANNLECIQVSDGGATKVIRRRDSTAERPQYRGRNSTPSHNDGEALLPDTVSEEVAPAHAEDSSVLFPPAPPPSLTPGCSEATPVPQRDARRRQVATDQRSRRKADEKEQLDSLVAAKRLRPSSAPPAAVRMAALRERVVARACPPALQ